MLFKKPFLVAALLLLSIAVPASAHDLPMGGSRWTFGKNGILGFIDLKSPLFCEIKPIKDGHYNLDTASADQLQQIAASVIQPYINQRLSITVNGKLYPVKVTALGRNADNLYTISLAATNVHFTQPVNEVKIAYSLLFDETGNQHINLAFGYLSDATGAALQKIFDYSHPEFQATFDSKDTVWDVSVKGLADVHAASDATAAPAGNSSAVANSSMKEGSRNRVAQKHAASGVPVSVVIPKEDQHKSEADNGAAIASRPSTREAISDASGNHSTAQGAAKWSVWSTFCQFIPLGIEHILTGYDHIAFLLGIIVIELSIKEILKIITAFTVAHSLTLLLAALEIVRLNSAFVESVIAFSICYVALENVFRKEVHYRWVITFGFGLIHGFGFASVLRDLIVGKSNLLVSVLCFNMGVEIGQLMLFFVMLPILYLLKKQIGFRTVTVGTSVIIFLIGFTWFIERVSQLKLSWF